jgi:hypothetical protein
MVIDLAAAGDEEEEVEAENGGVDGDAGDGRLDPANNLLAGFHANVAQPAEVLGRIGVLGGNGGGIEGKLDVDAIQMYRQFIAHLT